MSGIEIVLLVLLASLMIMQIWALFGRRQPAGAEAGDGQIQLLLQDLFRQQAMALERTERMLGEQIQTSAQANRQEQAAALLRFQQVWTAQAGQLAQAQKNQMDSFSQQLLQLRDALQAQAAQGRDEQSATLKRFADTLQQALHALSESNAQRLNEIRQTLEQQLQRLQEENAGKLDEMRRTVDEKLHATLEQRLGESFKLVSDRLEKVHQGLGEMQQLAVGVGDLKRVLSNVKTRGTWGEVQLEMVLEQMLTADQYGKNVETIPGSGARVEFAIRLPGKDDSNAPVWLPIDAKFPKEQYERLLDAADRADADGVANAGKELERMIRGEAKTIAEKYLSPPLTTDFAILFLPTEGLYAEVLRRPGLADDLQRLYRINVAGPSSLSALLNSLQMGFRTLALEKRSSEVWQVLGAVKTEFGKFGDVLAATKQALEKVSRSIDQAELRTRQMNRKLKQVEALPQPQADSVLKLSQEAGLPDDSAD